MRALTQFGAQAGLTLLLCGAALPGCDNDAGNPERASHPSVEPPRPAVSGDTFTPTQIRPASAGPSQGVAGSGTAMGPARDATVPDSMPASTDPKADAGTEDASPPAPQPPMFGARVEGDHEVVVDVTGADGFFAESCTTYDPKLEKRVDVDTWIALQDDRPPWWFNPGYYLDGEYVSPHGSLGCDVISCYALESKLHAGKALEFVKTGTLPPPADAMADLGAPIEIADPADVIETRAVDAELRVRAKYSTNAECRRAPTEVFVPVE